MKQCFGYTRVSTVKQGEGVSLQEQKDAILAFAERNDLAIAAWFEEKETAAKSGRPVFNTMLRQIRKGKAAGLIIHKIDRSARNLKDWSIISELPDEGIAVYIATESVDFTTRGGRLTADMLAVIAADYIRNLREEVKKGIRGRLKQGLYPRYAPLGYLDNGGGVPKSPCPTRAPFIRETYDLYATGEYSLRSLGEEMNRRGLRSRHGRPVSRRCIERILNNPFYTGVIAVTRTGETYQGIHEPIIPVSLYRRVQELKAGKSGPKRTKHRYLFRRLFHCGLCKRVMTPSLHKGRVYYRCHTSDCRTKTVREDVIQETIVSELKKYEITEKCAEKLETMREKKLNTIAADTKRKSIQLRIETLKQQMDRMTELVIDGTLDETTYLTKKRDICLTRTELEKALVDLPSPQAIAKKRTQYFELMKSLVTLYEKLEMDEKRLFVENTFSNRIVVGRKPYFTPYSWLQSTSNDVPVPFGGEDGATTPTFSIPEAIYHLFKRYFGDCREE